ncbi:cation:proton antiporter domain-containing protein [Nocardioides sp. SYSU DS0663]|uniref:cation:proton antiporter domain-containing protein n=1 Tax=Nocardioides sp. SYSU DS0663 TaxID=3416445 RepID=UPI003F4BBB22
MSSHAVHLAEVLAVVVAVVGLVVAVLSARIRRLPLSEPLLAVGAGVLVGPQVLGWLDVHPITEDGRVLHHAAAVLLALSVMAISLRYPFRDGLRHWRPLALLLLVVMPLMALATGALAWTVLGVPVAAAAVLGAALCPTDPVLASSVVTGDPAKKTLPGRTRLLLSWESGANDGLALPLVVAALALMPHLGGGAATTEILRAVLGGLLLGVVVGEIASRAINAGEEHGAANGTPIVVFTLVLAIGVLAAARLLHVGSVLAVFVTGMVINLRTRGDDRIRALTFDEALNRFAGLPFFALLGAALPWAEWQRIGWGPILLLAVAVLLLRRPPWLLALARPLRLPRADAVFLGWFGPIGVSAIFYLTEVGHRGASATVVAAGTAVVFVSVLAHGFSSDPGRRLYAARVGHRGEAEEQHGGGD